MSDLETIGAPSMLRLIHSATPFVERLWSTILVICEKNYTRNKARAKQKTYMSVDVMKDYNLKLRDLYSSHTLGFAGDWNT